MLDCSIYTALEPTVSGNPQSQKSDGFKRVSACGKLKMQCSYVARTITKCPLSGAAHKHRFDCTFQGYA